MKVELSEKQTQLLISLGLVAATFILGIPWIDLDNSEATLAAVAGIPKPCLTVDPNEPVVALVLLSAGYEREELTEPNYPEKRRIDALVYQYLELLSRGTPPRVIILALDDGITKTYKVRNRIQIVTDKIQPGTEIPNNTFYTVHADHTDTSIVAVASLLEELRLEGPVSFVTSEPHVNRALYNSCRHLPGRASVISADQVLALKDPDTFQQMEALKKQRSYKYASSIEKAKILTWLWRPNNINK